MSTLSWNCRGLGQPWTVCILAEVVRNKKPTFIFHMETLCSRNKLERIKIQLGYDGLFVVDRVGRSGGLVLFWKATSNVNLLQFGTNFMDAKVEVPVLGKWRLTGYYGYHESSRRRKSWDLLHLLASSSSLPWMCIGDFNDLLAANEKRGSIAHPNWKLVGLQRAITDCNLVDLGIDEYQFTWERARGTDKWVEEMLDRAFASEEWIHRFKKVKVYILDSSCSDHLPILLDPSPTQPIWRQNRFHFENSWLREADCSDVIRDSWSSYTGDSIQHRIMLCGFALMEWGGHFARDFRQQIRDCKKYMAALRGR